MSTELTVLALAALLQGIQFSAYSVIANRDVGFGYASSARDRPPSREMSVLGGRLQRALTNHFEGLILFTIAVLVTTLGDQSTALTRACAWIYLAARLLYIPAYAFGWRPWRTLIWSVGFAATMIMVIAALL